MTDQQLLPYCKRSQFCSCFQVNLKAFDSPFNKCQPLYLGPFRKVSSGKQTIWPYEFLMLLVQISPQLWIHFTLMKPFTISRSVSISSAWKGENHMDFSWSSITSANTYVVLKQNNAKDLSVMNHNQLQVYTAPQNLGWTLLPCPWYLHDVKYIGTSQQ